MKFTASALTHALTGLLLIAVLTACGQAGYTEAEHLERAIAFEQDGDLAASVIELKNVLQQNPGHAEARWRLGQALLAQGQPSAALTELERARDLGWNAAVVTLAMARARSDLGEHNRVAELLDDLELADLDVADRRAAGILLGRTLLGQERIEEAREAFSTVLTEHPDHAPAGIGLARVALLNAETDLAREHLEQALAADPAAIEAWELLGHLEQSLGNPEQAEAAYGEFIRHAANPYTGHYHRALVRLARDNPQEARTDLQVLQRLAEEHPLTRYVAGAVHLAERDFATASEHFDAVLDRDPDYLPARYYAGVAHYAQGNLPRAERHLTRFLSAQPQADMAARLLAELRLRRGDAEGAGQLIEQVIRRNPEDVVMLDMLAGLELREGQREQAIDRLEYLRRIQPESPRAHARLAAALLQAGERERGLAEFDIARELAPEADELDAALIIYHLQQGEFAKALEEARGLADKRPERAAAHTLVGIALLGLQRFDEAQQAFETARQRAPGDYQATRGLASLAMLRGDSEQVRTLFQQALEHRPQALDLLLALASFEAQQDRIERAVELTQQAVAAHPQALQPRLILARHYLMDNQPAQALTLLEPLADTYGRQPALVEVLARAQLGVGRTEAGISSLRQLVRLQPDTAAAHWLLGAALQQAGRSRQAQDALMRVLELEPEHPQALRSLSHLQRVAGQFDSAQALALRLQAIDGWEAQGLWLEAEVALSRGDTAAAIRALQRVYQQVPSPEIALRLYTAHHQAGDGAAGLAVLQEQLQRTPDHDALNLALGTELMLQDNHTAAAESLERVFQRQPDSYVVANNLALAYHYAGDDRALATARRAHQLQADDPRVKDTLGLILWAHGELEDALPLLREAHQALPDEPSVHFHYARALADTGQRANARISLSELLASERPFPEQEEARVLLQSLR